MFEFSQQISLTHDDVDIAGRSRSVVDEPPVSQPETGQSPKHGCFARRIWTRIRSKPAQNTVTFRSLVRPRARCARTTDRSVSLDALCSSYRRGLHVRCHDRSSGPWRRATAAHSRFWQFRSNAHRQSDCSLHREYHRSDTAALSAGHRGQVDGLAIDATVSSRCTTTRSRIEPCCDLVCAIAR